jgi:AraC-like DNA-binding protein
MGSSTAAARAPQVLEYSTASTPRSERLQHWHQIAERVFGPCHIEPDRESELSGSVRSVERCGVRISDLAYRGQIVERRASDIAKVEHEYYTLSFPLAGPLWARSAGQDVTVTPGALFLVNQCLPYRASTKTGYRSKSIVLPTDALRQRETRLDPWYRIALSEPSPRAGLLLHYMNHLEAGLGQWSDAELSGLMESFTDLVALLVLRHERAWLSEADASVRAAHHDRAVAYIRQHLSDPALRPESVAAGCGVSLRYLHQVFRHAELSVEQRIYTERVRAACTLLQQASHRDRPISQIAWQVGFTQASHFSRTFKAHTGVTPRAFRDGG